MFIKFISLRQESRGKERETKLPRLESSGHCSLLSEILGIKTHKCEDLASLIFRAVALCLSGAMRTSSILRQTVTASKVFLDSDQANEGSGVADV